MRMFLAFLLITASLAFADEPTKPQQEFPKITSITMCYDAGATDHIGMALDFKGAKTDSGKLIDDSEFVRFEASLEAVEYDGDKPEPLTLKEWQKDDPAVFGDHAWSLWFNLPEGTPNAVFKNNELRAYRKDGTWVTLRGSFQAPMCGYLAKH